MAKTIKTLTIREVETDPRAEFAVGGAQNLYYRKSAKQYFFRWKENGKQKKQFLPKNTTLKKARETAREWLNLLGQGISPKDYEKQKRAIDEAETRKQELIKIEKEATFSEGFKRLEAWQKQTGRWKNNPRDEKRQSQCTQKYIMPVFADTPLTEITTQQVANLLIDMYRAELSHDTVGRIKKTIKQVYNVANMQGYGNLNGYTPINETLEAFIAPAKKNAKPPQHQPSLPYQLIPDFVREVASYNSDSAKVILFGILTATRSQAARYARRSDIDLENGIYWIRTDDDKVKREPDKRIFLAKPVIEWLKQLPNFGEFLFPSQDTFKPLNENSPKQFIKKLHIKKVAIDGKGWIDPEIKDKDGKPRMITFHGMRSSYRTWCADAEGANHKPFNRDAVEFNMLHFNSTMSKVERAYNRAKLDKERREIMEEWAKYCLSKTDIKPINP